MTTVAELRKQLSLLGGRPFSRTLGRSDFRKGRPRKADLEHLVEAAEQEVELSGESPHPVVFYLPSSVGNQYYPHSYFSAEEVLEKHLDYDSIEAFARWSANQKGTEPVTCRFGPYYIRAERFKRKVTKGSTL